MQALFYGSAVIYPITMVMDRSTVLAQALLMNPVAQAIQDIRHILVNPANQTLYTISDSWLISLIPIGIVIVVAIFGAVYFKRRSPHFAEEI